MTSRDETLHSDAVKAALDLQFTGPGSPAVYTWSDLEALPTKPERYVVFDVTPMYVPTYRVSADKPLGSWRVNTRYVDKVAVVNAQTMRRKAWAALEKRVLTIAGAETTPICFEAAVPIGQDNEFWWTGLDSWTYTL